MKICSKCRTSKAITDFHKDPKHKDGLRSECKECQGARIKEWNDNHKEWRKKRDAQYHREHYRKSKRAAYYRKRYQDNKERIKQQNREYRMKHKAQAVIRTAKYRSTKLSLEATLTNEQWEGLKLMFKNRCIYCGKRTKRLEREHIIPVSCGGSFTLQNIVPSCRSCNARKGTNPPTLPINLALL